jgi:hypothetical protein
MTGSGELRCANDTKSGAHVARATRVSQLVVLTAGGAALAAGLGISSDSPQEVRAAFVLLAGACGTVAIAAPALRERRWFDPLAFPLLYVVVALSAPVIYLVLLRRPFGALQPESVPLEAITVFGLTIAGLVVGLVAGRRFDLLDDLPSRALDARSLLIFGRSSLVLAVLLRGYTVASQLGQRYGEQSVGFGLDKSLDNLAVALFFSGCCLVVLGNLHSRRAVLSWADLGLLTGFVLPTLISGSRGELAAPLIFVMWARHTFVRPLGFRLLAIIAITTLVVFQGILGVRSGQGFYDGLSPASERTLIAIGSPLLVTKLLVDRVPGGYSGGATYVAALKRQLPSPIAGAFFGPPDDTGTFVLREILNLRSPDAGLGFSFPSEAYLNFGLYGAFGIAAGVGLLIGLAWTSSARLPTRATEVFYPVLVAWLPLNFRADALQQIKVVLYPMVFLAACLVVSHHRAQRRQRTRPVLSNTGAATDHTGGTPSV